MAPKAARAMASGRMARSAWEALVAVTWNST